MANKRMPKPKDNGKKLKKKTSILAAEKVVYVDYKDVNLLNRFVSDRSKIRARRVSGNDVQQQRDIATAIKNAREMALVPYAKKVTTQRTSRPSRDKDAESAAVSPEELDDITTELELGDEEGGE
jgi:small subunit ribosomal protein S18